MSNLSEKTQEVLARLALAVGLKENDAQKLDRFATRLAQQKAKNEDGVEELKEKILGLEAKARQKKKLYDVAKGGTKRILAGEIERLLREMDLLQGKEKLINRNLDQIAKVQSKLEEIVSAQKDGLSPDEIDDIAESLDDSYESLRDSDRAVADMDRIGYSAPEEPSKDIEEGMAEVEGKEKSEGILSSKSLDRLK